MKQINKLSVLYRDQKVGELTMTPDNRQCVFQYDKTWLLSAATENGRYRPRTI